MIWWIALIGSLAVLALFVPYLLLLCAEAAKEARDTRGRRPCPTVTKDRPAPRMPMARLTGREYRRIRREQEAYRRTTYMRNPYRAA